VDDAGCGDDFVRGIAVEIQLRRLPANSEIQRPGVDSTEHSGELGRIEVDFDSLQLGELRELPKNDHRDAPRVRVEEPPLGQMESPS